MTHKAVFLDRDGVLVHDSGLVTDRSQLVLMEDVPEALRLLKQAGYLLIVTTNQAVVARGLLTEAALEALHDALQEMLSSRGSPRLDAIFACPHHPNADVPEFKIACECRKPMPGLLTSAAAMYGIDLARSYMVGDRPTDVLAGRRAGCRTILLETGQHLAAPIETAGGPQEPAQPDFVEANLAAAARRIVSSL